METPDLPQRSQTDPLPRRSKSTPSGGRESKERDLGNKYGTPRTYVHIEGIIYKINA